jgi:ATP-binding cassette subfamily B protein
MTLWLEALDKAGLKEKIENLPAGLDTVLTKEFDDNGLVLSGGERQKLVLARVFASSAPIIIFDEPTSALDPMAEYDINKKIIDLAKEKTVIMISHRLSTIVDAQTIYLLDGGKVLESGNHESLLRMKGKYFKMFETQAQLYRE